VNGSLRRSKSGRVRVGGAVHSHGMEVVNFQAAGAEGKGEEGRGKREREEGRGKWEVGREKRGGGEGEGEGGGPVWWRASKGGKGTRDGASERPRGHTRRGAMPYLAGQGPPCEGSGGAPVNGWVSQRPGVDGRE
jgi:hypothetical protein